MANVVIVDDEDGVRGMLAVILRRDGHEVWTYPTGGAAIAAIDQHRPEVLITDLRMEPMDGLAVLQQARARPEAPFVVLMTAFAEWDTAVRAMRLGAYDVLRKPFDNAHVRSLVARAAAARDRHLAAAAGGGEAHQTVQIIGSTPVIQAVLQLVEQVSTTDSTVLVTGESGTGKELVARAVHYASLRADGPMVRINSGALAPTLLESELFGHMKGAFTGAIEDRPGLFELAHKGTLFLDEVGDLAAETQVKLLRVLESGEYLPVGGREVRRCDVRVVAATNRDLPAMVAAGTFREDLYYRLAVIPVHLPALRERREDIPLIAGHLLARHAVKLRRGVMGFTRECLAQMQTYPWPGNIRELDNRIQRGVALTPSGDIGVGAVFNDLGPRPGQGGLRPASSAHVVSPASLLTARIAQGGRVDLEHEVQIFERDVVSAALARCRDNVAEAAELLGISPSQIRYRIKQLGLR